MSFDAGSILARLKLDQSGFSSGIINAQSMASAFGPTISGFMTNPILGAVNASKQLFGLWGTQQKAEATLTAVAKERGQAFVEAAKQQASALQELTSIGDETILKGQAVLATFKNIDGPIFDRAIASALDMGAVLGGDAASNAKMLGRALDEPVQGMSALSRMGIVFSESQKAVIQNLVETGNAVEAQSMMLDLLEGKFGGAAAAAGEADGGWQKMKNTLGDLGETLGGVIAPILSTVAKLLEPILKLLQPIAELIGMIVEYATRPLQWLAGGLGDLVNGSMGLPTSSDRSVPSVNVSVRPEDSARRIAAQVSPAIERGVQRGVYQTETAIRWRANRAAEDASILT